jgi:hypothetical protein
MQRQLHQDYRVSDRRAVFLDPVPEQERPRVAVCLSCQVPGQCVPSHPLCGIRDQLRALQRPPVPQEQRRETPAAAAHREIYDAVRAAGRRGIAWETLAEDLGVALGTAEATTLRHRTKWMVRKGWLARPQRARLAAVPGARRP